MSRHILRHILVGVVVTLCTVGLGLAQVNWHPTGLYSGNFITVQQCQASSGAYYMASTGPNIYRTTDGITWTDVTAQFGGNQVYSFASWTQTLQYYTMAGTSAGVYRTSDGGLTWTQMTTLPTNLSVWSVYAAGNGNLLAGTNDGLYYSNTYGATAWTKATTLTATDVYGFCMYAISGQYHYYCGTSDGVWYSAYPSYGTSWTELNSADTNARRSRRS